MGEISSGLVAVRIDTDGYQLVRLSDAEAIIAQQSERIKELESDVDEEAHIRDRMAKLLAETAVALKGPEKALHRHGWQDLPDVAAKQSAALKLARELLPSRIPNGFVSFGKCYSEQEDLFADPYNKMSKFKRDYLTRCEEALAAIDALGEVN